MLKLVVLLLISLLSACTFTPQSEPTTPKLVYNSTQRFPSQYSVIAIDSCEYLVTNRGQGGMMTHKGNCKRCVAVRGW